MPTKHYLSLYLLLTIVFSGCLTAQERAYKLDTATGLFEVVYHDLRSAQEDDAPEGSLEEDWKMVQDNLQEIDDYIPEVISVKSKELFQEGDVLSAKAVYQVHCPRCFPSTAELLAMLNHDDLDVDVINGELFLMFPTGTLLTSANGQIIKTEKNTIVVWPESASIFEYTVNDQSKGGVSLLERHLQEIKNK